MYFCAHKAVSQKPSPLAKRNTSCSSAATGPVKVGPLHAFPDKAGVNAGDCALQLNPFENAKMWILLYNGSRRSQGCRPKEASPKPRAGSDFSPSTPPSKGKKTERKRNSASERKTAEEGRPPRTRISLQDNRTKTIQLSHRPWGLTWFIEPWHLRCRSFQVLSHFPKKPPPSPSADPWVPVKNPSERSRKRGAGPWQPCLRLQREGRVWMKSSFIRVNAGKFASPHPGLVSFGKLSKTQQ